MRRLALILLLIAACDSGDRPVDPVWGKQPCGACSMLVSDPHTAAQLITRNGDHVFFDDIGCMLSSSKYAAARSLWVRNGAGQWVDARAARYGQGATPMDYGFVVAEQGTDLASVERAVAARGAHP